MKQLKKFGEFNLINYIKNTSAKAKGLLKTGIGDDTAVFAGRPGWVLLATTDMLAEGVHFLTEMPAKKIGEKALLSSVSDIAAMGGKPLYALISVGLRKNLPAGFALDLFAGINKAAGSCGVKIIGGDTVSAKTNIINVVVLGEAKNNKYALRSGAKEKDFILVTGPLGNGAAAFLDKKIYLPNLKISFAARAVEKGLINAMIDISDGLSSEVHHLAKESGLGAFIDLKAVPLGPAVTKTAARAHKQPYELALNGGEDYELLFTVAPAKLGKVLTLAKNSTVKVTVLGVMRNKKHGVKIAGLDGELKALIRKGYDHFA